MIEALPLSWSRSKEEYSDISDWAGKLIGNTHRIAGLLCRASVFRSHDFLDAGAPGNRRRYDGKCNPHSTIFYLTRKAAFSLMER